MPVSACEHIKAQLAQLVADFLTRLPITRLSNRIVDCCIVVMDRANERGVDDSGRNDN